MPRSAAATRVLACSPTMTTDTVRIPDTTKPKGHPMKAKRYLPLPEAAALLAGFQRRDAKLVAKADAALAARGIKVQLFPEKRAVVPHLAGPSL